MGELLSKRWFQFSIVLIALLAAGNVVLWVLAVHRKAPVAAPTRVIAPPPAPGPGWAAEDYDVIEAVVRHVLGSNSGLVGRTIFLKSPGEVYPGDQFMKRFANCRQRVRFVGIDKMSRTKGCTYVDDATGEEISILTITVAKRKSVNELDVEVELYAGPTGMERYTCRVARDGPGMPWVVHEPKVKELAQY